MYVLYGNIKGMKELEHSPYEEEIKVKLGYYIKTLDSIEYIVINKTPKQDFIIKSIMTYKDYENYINTPQKTLTKHL